MQVPIKLVQHEQEKRCDREGICPPTSEEEAQDEDNFDCPMPEEVDGSECLCAGSQLESTVEYMSGNCILRVLAELMLREDPDHGVNAVGRHEEEKEATGNFQRTVDCLGDNSDIKEDMENLLLR